MRLRPLSDLHFEFHADRGKEFVGCQDPGGVDLVVLAGDIARQDAGIHHSLSLFRQRMRGPIVFVPGNHEYHRTDRASVVQARNHVESTLRGVHWLDGDLVEIDGVRILGTTLWYRRPKAPVHLDARLTSTDEEWARGIGHGLSADGDKPYVFVDFQEIPSLSSWVYDESARGLRFLDENLREGDVVVTHFLPSQLSVTPRYANTISNCWYVNDVEALIRERKPALWIHGHTHDSLDYTIGSTRVVCNPLGYVTLGRFNPSFDEKLIVDVHR